jgi:hypothetical protein
MRAPLLLSTMYAPLPAPSQGQPTGPPPVVRPRRARLNWIRIAIVGTVGGLLIVGGLAAAASLSKGWNTASAFGVPQDFPVYKGARLIGVKENIASNGTSVSASWDADASVDAVTAFYEQRLNQQPWAVTAKNPIDGAWKFRRTDGKTAGIIQLSSHGQRTRIDILLVK